MALSPGDVVEGYRIIGEIGEGGMAIVYRAHHNVLQSEHAIKVLRERFLRQEDTRQRFLAEGRIQARMQHPNMVPVTDVLSAPGVAGLVMPLLSGLDLAQHLARRGALPQEEVLHWVDQILQALSFVHERGIIHRDLKPANIFIDQQPHGAVARIMDFGIAKVTNQSRTQTSMAMGTPAYMSPEQIRSPKNVDARTDLFAMGSILYEMLTGRQAFCGETEFDTQSRIVNGDIPDLYRDLQGVAPHIVAVIARALCVDPTDRFASAEQFRQALKQPVVMHAHGRAQARPPAPPTPVAPEEVPPEQPAVPQHQPPPARRRPMELGLFRVGRTNRLFLAFTGALAATTLGMVLPDHFPLVEGVMVGLVVGYWLFELGCLSLLLIVGILLIGALTEGVLV